MEASLKVLYSRKEAALALALSESSLDELIAQGRLRASRLGRRLLIHRREIERFADLVASGQADAIWHKPWPKKQAVA